MLSAQIDKLRHEADMLRDHGTFIGYGGLTNTDPEMIECADLMCDAADTIWQLRDDLQRTNAVLMDVEHDESMAWNRVCKAEAEAERLRKLAQCADRLLTDLFPYIDYSRCTALEAVAAWRVRARELGIEADQ